MKFCVKCSKSLPLSRFWNSKRSKDGKQHYCKNCQNSLKSFYYYKDPLIKQKSKIKNKRFRANNPDYHLRYRYGITKEDYVKQLVIQNNVCAICKQPSEYKLRVDHNHKTEEVRSLLCINCNTVLGHARENTEILYSMIDYIKSYE